MESQFQHGCGLASRWSIVYNHIMDNQDYVYESPDGGETIYRRRMGYAERHVVQETPLRRAMLRNQLWRDIFQAAESDAELNYMIERVEIYHRLKSPTQP